MKKIKFLVTALLMGIHTVSATSFATSMLFGNIREKLNPVNLAIDTKKVDKAIDELQALLKQANDNMTDLKNNVNNNLGSFNENVNENMNQLNRNFNRNLDKFTEDVDKNLHTFTGDIKKATNKIKVTARRIEMFMLLTSGAIILATLKYIIIPAIIDFNAYRKKKGLKMSRQEKFSMDDKLL